MLTHPVYKEWSNRKIAEETGFSHTFVNGVRSGMNSDAPIKVEALPPAIEPQRPTEGVEALPPPDSADLKTNEPPKQTTAPSPTPTKPPVNLSAYMSGPELSPARREQDITKIEQVCGPNPALREPGQFSDRELALMASLSDAELREVYHKRLCGWSTFYESIRCIRAVTGSATLDELLDLHRRFGHFLLERGKVRVEIFNDANRNIPAIR